MEGSTDSVVELAGVSWRNKRHLFRKRMVTHLLGADPDPGSGCLSSPALTFVSIVASHHSRLAETPKTLSLLQNNTSHFSAKAAK